MPILKDQPLIVVGYRGAQPSVIEQLRLSNAERANHSKDSINWYLGWGGPPDSTRLCQNIVPEGWSELCFCRH